MESEPLFPRSHLFTVRLWLEPLGDGQSEWRGKVQHVPGGEARYFREWPALVIFLERALAESGRVEEPQPTRMEEKEKESHNEQGSCGTQ